MANESEPSNFLITLTSDIAAAHLSNNEVALAQVPMLIQGIYEALSQLGLPIEPEAVRLEPAVSIRASIKPDSITCLDCGKKMKMIKRHLSTEHGMPVGEYRARWNLPTNYPLVAPNYAEQRRELAKTIGLGRKPQARRGRRPAS